MKDKMCPWKLNCYALTQTKVFLNQKIINVCVHTAKMALCDVVIHNPHISEFLS